MKLESIIIQVPTKHIEWCFLDFTREDGKGVEGSLISSREVLKSYSSYNGRERWKQLQPIDKSCSLESLMDSDKLHELKTLEEYIPGIQYLVNINMEYGVSRPFIETFRSLDSVYEFLKQEEIKCVYKGETFAELISQYSQIGAKNLPQYLEHLCEQLGVRCEYKGVFVEEVDHGGEFKECRNVERSKFIFDDGSTLLLQDGSDDVSLSKIIEIG